MAYLTLATGISIGFLVGLVIGVWYGSCPPGGHRWSSYQNATTCTL